MSVAMLCEQLSKAGHPVNVFTTTANGDHELDVIPGSSAFIDGVQVNYFKRITKDHSHFSPALLKSLWKTVKNYNVVHIHAWWNLVSVLSCVIAVWRGVPVLISARGTLSPYSFQNKHKGVKLLIHRLLGISLLKKCHFHTTSDRENEAIRAIITPKSITNIANFVKSSPLENKLIRHISSPSRLIFLSRIEEKKGLDILIRSLPELTFPYTLTVAGDGDKNYISWLKMLAKENHVDHHISWIGFQNEQKFELLREHDLLVLTSHDENFGNVVIESLSQGTPVLLSKKVGLSNYVTKGGLGWDCELNPGDISNKLNHILNDTDELDRIREIAPAKILADFDSESLLKQYIALYNGITANHQ
jgi:glycosyltransferase involved in cell wall biosynthesis